jgi:hypothetical protein
MKKIITLVLSAIVCCTVMLGCTGSSGDGSSFDPPNNEDGPPPVTDKQCADSNNCNEEYIESYPSVINPTVATALPKISVSKVVAPSSGETNQFTVDVTVDVSETYTFSSNVMCNANFTIKSNDPTETSNCEANKICSVNGVANHEKSSQLKFVLLFSKEAQGAECTILASGSYYISEKGKPSQLASSTAETKVTLSNITMVEALPKAQDYGSTVSVTLLGPIGKHAMTCKCTLKSNPAKEITTDCSLGNYQNSKFTNKYPLSFKAPLYPVTCTASIEGNEGEVTFDWSPLTGEIPPLKKIQELSICANTSADAKNWYVTLAQMKDSFTIGGADTIDDFLYMAGEDTKATIKIAVTDTEADFNHMTRVYNLTDLKKSCNLLGYCATPDSINKELRPQLKIQTYDLNDRYLSSDGCETPLKEVAIPSGTVVNFKTKTLKLDPIVPTIFLQGAPDLTIKDDIGTQYDYEISTASKEGIKSIEFVCTNSNLVIGLRTKLAPGTTDFKSQLTFKVDETNLGEQQCIVTATSTKEQINKKIFKVILK